MSMKFGYDMCTHNVEVNVFSLHCVCLANVKAGVGLASVCDN